MARHEIVKHIAAIHISNSISLLERKVSNVLLRHAWERLETSEIHTINIGDLADAVGFDSNDTEILKDALRSLVGTTIEWNILGQDKKNEWGVTTILASAFIREGDGICEYSYPAHIVPFLRNPNIFARLNLLIQRRFDSKYSLALWEYATGQIALSGDTEDVIVTPWLALDSIHELFGSTDSQYATTFKWFNQDILKPAITEINKISDIEITNTERRRKNRKITALRFSICPKEAHQFSIGLEIPPFFIDGKSSEHHSDANCEKIQLFNRLMAYGIEEKAARGLVRGFGVDRITENLEWAVQQIESGRQIDRPSGFIASAIRRDFVAPERVKRKNTNDVKHKEKTKQDRTALIEKLKGNFWLYKVSIVKCKIASFSIEERERFERVLEECNVFLTRARLEEYRREGITDKREHTPLRGFFYGFAISQFLSDEERDILVYARSQGADDEIIRELQTHAPSRS